MSHDDTDTTQRGKACATNKSAHFVKQSDLPSLNDELLFSGSRQMQVGKPNKFSVTLQ